MIKLKDTEKEKYRVEASKSDLVLNKKSTNFTISRPLFLSPPCCFVLIISSGKRVTAETNPPAPPLRALTRVSLEDIVGNLKTDLLDSKCCNGELQRIYFFISGTTGYYNYHTDSRHTGTPHFFSLMSPLFRSRFEQKETL